MHLRRAGGHVGAGSAARSAAPSLPSPPPCRRARQRDHSAIGPRPRPTARGRKGVVAGAVVRACKGRRRRPRQHLEPESPLASTTAEYALPTPSATVLPTCGVTGGHDDQSQSEVADSMAKLTATWAWPTALIPPLREDPSLEAKLMALLRSVGEPDLAYYSAARKVALLMEGSAPRPGG